MYRPNKTTLSRRHSVKISHLLVTDSSEEKGLHKRVERKIGLDSLPLCAKDL